MVYNRKQSIGHLQNLYLIKQFKWFQIENNLLYTTFFFYLIELFIMTYPILVNTFSYLQENLTFELFQIENKLL